MDIKIHDNTYYKTTEKLLREYSLINAAIDDVDKQLELLEFEDGGFGNKVL